MIVCDSSSIIALNETCNSQIFHFLEDLDFVIPIHVKNEIVSTPLKIKRFEIGALRIQLLLKEKNIRVIAKEEVINEKAEKIMKLANGIFSIDNKPLTLIQIGEAGCIALISAMKSRLFLVDEKTTRMLIEDPIALQRIIQEEHGKKVKINQDNLKRFKDLTQDMVVIRSTELATIAARRGFFSRFEEFEKEAFHSTIYALRFAGCSITTQEIEDYEEMDISPPYPKG